MYSPEKPAPTITASRSVEGALFEMAGINGHGNAGVDSDVGPWAGAARCGANSLDRVRTVGRLWP